MEGVNQDSLPKTVHSPRIKNRWIYGLVIVALYFIDLVAGVLVLFYGTNFQTPYVSLISILNWTGAWVLCYFGYKRSKKFGIGLVILTVILTVLIIAGFLLLLLFMAASNEG